MSENTNTFLFNLILQELLLSALAQPVPRVVFDSIIRCANIDLLLETLEERHRARGLVNAGHVPQNIELQPAVKNVSWVWNRMLSPNTVKLD